MGRRKISNEITLEMKSFEKRVARKEYQVEFCFYDNSKIDIKEE